jgi:hypothetical protein
MKTIQIIILMLVGVYITACSKNCSLEKEKVHTVAAPLVKKLANYAKSNGIPKSFEDIKDLPYNLESCLIKPNLSICQGFKSGYFFKKDNEYYSVGFSWIPIQESPNGFGLNITHNTTHCTYQIYYDGKLEPNYLEPTCALIGSCRAWGKQ